jgi:redox-sensitive bicupin YhaK (pirin superfamily)
MIQVRESDKRGRTQLEWLDSRHTFSFGEYHDPAHMGFRSLRVINEDRVHPGEGFGTHGHADMEIVSYVLEGALQHRDSLGNGSIIRPGDVQRMSAGTGVTHSEYNPSREEGTHFLQIWIVPGRRGMAPGYEQKAFPQEEMTGKWRVVGSPDGREGSVTIHQDVGMLAAVLSSGDAIPYGISPGRHAWIQVARGAIAVNGIPLRAGDGAAISDEGAIEVRAEEPSEVLLFDLA